MSLNPLRVNSERFKMFKKAASAEKNTYNQALTSRNNINSDKKDVNISQYGRSNNSQANNNNNENKEPESTQIKPKFDNEILQFFDNSKQNPPTEIDNNNPNTNTTLPLKSILDRILLKGNNNNNNISNNSNNQHYHYHHLNLPPTSENTSLSNSYNICNFKKSPTSNDNNNKILEEYHNPNYIPPTACITPATTNRDINNVNQNNGDSNMGMGYDKLFPLKLDHDLNIAISPSFASKAGWRCSTPDSNLKIFEYPYSNTSTQRNSQSNDRFIKNAICRVVGNENLEISELKLINLKNRIESCLNNTRERIDNNNTNTNTNNNDSKDLIIKPITPNKFIQINAELSEFLNEKHVLEHKFENIKNRCALLDSVSRMSNTNNNTDLTKTQFQGKFFSLFPNKTDNKSIELSLKSSVLKDHIPDFIHANGAAIISVNSDKDSQSLLSSKIFNAVNSKSSSNLMNNPNKDKMNTSVTAPFNVEESNSTASLRIKCSDSQNPKKQMHDAKEITTKLGQSLILASSSSSKLDSPKYKEKSPNKEKDFSNELKPEGNLTPEKGPNFKEEDLAILKPDSKLAVTRAKSVETISNKITEVEDEDERTQIFQNILEQHDNDLKVKQNIEPIKQSPESTKLCKSQLITSKSNSLRSLHHNLITIPTKESFVYETATVQDKCEISRNRPYTSFLRASKSSHKLTHSRAKSQSTLYSRKQSWINSLTDLETSFCRAHSLHKMEVCSEITNFQQRMESDIYLRRMKDKELERFLKRVKPKLISKLKNLGSKSANISRKTSIIKINESFEKRMLKDIKERLRKKCEYELMKTQMQEEQEEKERIEALARSKNLSKKNLNTLFDKLVTDGKRRNKQKTIIINQKIEKEIEVAKALANKKYVSNQKLNVDSKLKKYFEGPKPNEILISEMNNDPKITTNHLQQYPHNTHRHDLQNIELEENWNYKKILENIETLSPAKLEELENELKYLRQLRTDIQNNQDNLIKSFKAYENNQNQTNEILCSNIENSDTNPNKITSSTKKSMNNQSKPNISGLSKSRQNQQQQQQQSSNKKTHPLSNSNLTHLKLDHTSPPIISKTLTKPKNNIQEIIMPSPMNNQDLKTPKKPMTPRKNQRGISIMPSRKNSNSKGDSSIQNNHKNMSCEKKMSSEQTTATTATTTNSNKSTKYKFMNDKEALNYVNNLIQNFKVYGC